MITHKSVLLLLIAFVIIVILSCASQGKLSGGDPDEDPPQIDFSKSDANLQTNFTPRQIELHFDEFIKLSNPAKEIVVSPPLKYPLLSKVRGKKLTLSINEKDTLKEDATYSINFGNSIQDFTENNKLSNFNFVFSTGDYIDSLTISGTIVDAYTQEPMEEALVLVYDNLEDSIIFKERPFYFARTDKTGSFKINNIKNDSFQIFGLKDQNLNYYKDNDAEAMAFLDSIIVLTDSSQSKFNLAIYPVDLTLDIFTKNSKQAGIIRLSFNKEVEEPPSFSFSTDLQYYHKSEKDSMWIWYDTTAMSNFDLHMLGDTIKVRKNKMDPTKNKMVLYSKKMQKKIAYNDSLLVKCSHPILHLDTTKIILSDTSGLPLKYKYSIDTSDKRNFYIKTKWKNQITYNLSIQDSSLVSFNKIHNDSTDISFSVLPQESLGVIRFRLTQLDSNQYYVLRLMSKENEIKKWRILNQKETEFVLTDQLPQEYQFQLIEDLNNNGKWDTGNYQNKIQAERVTTQKMEKLKANWELEVPITPAILK